MQNNQSELLESIGQSAGEIWSYLNQNGEVSLAKMKKDLDLKGNFTELGLGWLARENKVNIAKRGTATKIKLV